MLFELILIYFVVLSDEIFTIVAYIILLVALIFNAVQERKFMIKKVGKNTILILVTNIANSIYALSFLFRISVSIWLLVDHDSIVHLQCVSCMHNTAGFATLIFMKHFICELLPLSAIFTLQLFTIRKAKHAKLRNTAHIQGSSLTNSIDENEVLNDHSFLLSPGNDLGNVNATALNSKRSKSNEG